MTIDKGQKRKCKNQITVDSKEDQIMSTDKLHNFSVEIEEIRIKECS